MIDLLSEERLSLTALARELDVSVSTVWRWNLRGIRGHRLECRNLGGRKYTTREAFTRFVEATNEETAPTSRTNRQREGDIARAEKDLAEAGW